MIKLLFVLLTLPAMSFANTSIGLTVGSHFGGDDLNNRHPYVQYQKDGYGAAAFINSFDGIGTTIYKKVSIEENGLEVNVKFGVITGYSRLNVYKGRIYELKRVPFITDGLIFMISPEMKFSVGPNLYLNTMIFGDSVSMGVGYTF